MGKGRTLRQASKDALTSSMNQSVFAEFRSPPQPKITALRDVSVL